MSEIHGERRTEVRDAEKKAAEPQMGVMLVTVNGIDYVPLSVAQKARDERDAAVKALERAAYVAERLHERADREAWRVAWSEWMQEVARPTLASLSAADTEPGGER